MSITDYNFAEIEKKWQSYWASNQTFKTPDLPGDKPKCYVLDMFPYPSGSGLHVGHPEGYTATDIYCRFMRQRGYSVLHPMGWDAFGLPAEQYAVETGTHPAITTAENINTFKRQIQALGFSYDWDREINTTDPGYYKWTQWIFKQLYKKGLAYIAEAPVNWCPALGTVLSNEEVVNGRSERGDHPVERRPMRQWMLRITEYAERLLNDLDDLDWSEGIKEMQRNWIGKSVGAEVVFSFDRPEGETITVFTTRPDTLFGATYMVLAPELALVDVITTADQKAEVDAYRKLAALKSDMDRTELSDAKTGVFTGCYAVNPVNGEKIPVWIADYVLASYGTGAIMAVPAHDTRDFEFAKAFGLPVICIIEPDAGEAAAEGVEVSAVLAGNACWTGSGRMIRSANADGLDLNGMHVEQSMQAATEWVTARGVGQAKIQYKLRDWLFSRQRYWGEPFPLVNMDDGSTMLLADDDLPLTLPELDDYKPTGTGEPPLAKAKQWLRYTDPKTGRQGWRETNTMPQWAGSCWYYLRYIDPHNDAAFVDPDKEKAWMPVDLYVGGAEHAVLHLLYARFWHKVLFDLGLVSTNEPFKKLVNQGMILGLSYKDRRGALVPNDQVEETPEGPVHKKTREKLLEFAAKMSKSLKNVINPDDVIREYGADSMRLYEMFMGPLEAAKPWNTQGVEGVYRFLRRSYRMIVDQPVEDVSMTADQARLCHATIKKVTKDIETLDLNTAISQLMIFLNDFAGNEKVIPREAAEAYVILLSPFAPHLGEELWSRLGHEGGIAYTPWPVYDEGLIKVSEAEIVVQVSGKIKARIIMPTEADSDTMQALALANEGVSEAIAGKPIRKVICVPGRIVNIVV